MFNNTVVLPIGQTQDEVVTTTLIDGPTNRRTQRAGSDGKSQFTIAHTESKENPGFVTQRSNVRLEQVIDVPESDKSVKAYVQLTTSIPKEQMSPVQLQKLTAKLINFVLNGDLATPDVLINHESLQAVPRLYAGEP